MHRSTRHTLAVALSSLALLVVPTGLALAGGEGHTHSGGLFDSWLTGIGALFLLGSAVTVPAYRRVGESLTPLHLAAALLAVFSGAVHLYLFADHGSLAMLAAGVGFLVGVGLLFTGVDRRALYLGGAAFTAVQLPLWVVEGAPHVGDFGLLDKVAQVVLVALLGYLYLTTTD